MLHTLNSIEELYLQHIVRNIKAQTMYIDYHKPFVSRIWFQWGKLRIFLHKIEPCKQTAEALYHPHKWKSAVRIISGTYEMGVGHSLNNDIPDTDCRLILKEGTQYEMVERDAWHYVNPIKNPVFSLMVTGESNKRDIMPIEPPSSFRQLNFEECFEILSMFNIYYKWEMSGSEATEICKRITSG